MLSDPRIPLYELTMCLSEALDLVSPALANHHKEVSYIALSLAMEMDWSTAQCNEVVLAGMLHDVGALSLQEKLDILYFDMDQPYRHAMLGYRLLSIFEPFSTVANLVRYHHHPWKIGETGEKIPAGSHVLNLADRVAVSMDKGQEPLGQVPGICAKIESLKGEKFAPAMVDAFLALARKEHFWLDLASPYSGAYLERRVRMDTLDLDLEKLLTLGRLISHVIDFRSRFTATHSSGVAAVAETLARMCDFSERECQMMRLAGYIHDLGKLAVPGEILEKPGKLTEAESNVMRSHTFHTCRILQRIPAMNTVNAWGSFHHERLDGSGYPFHHRAKDISLGSRIMAVADVFTAITEDRPYRKAMSEQQAREVLGQMAAENALDGRIVSLLEGYFKEINGVRSVAQEQAAQEYVKFGR